MNVNNVEIIITGGAGGSAADATVDMNLNRL